MSVSLIIKIYVWEFHHIYNFGAVGDKDIMITKRSKVKVTARTSALFWQRCTD